MNRLLRVPDKERNYQSYMVFVLSILWSVVSSAIVSIGFYFFPYEWLRWLAFLGLALLIGAINLTLNRFGYTRLASWLLTIMLWLYITIPCYSAGGIRAPGVLMQLSVILTAGFLLRWRGGLLVGLFTMAADFVLAYLEITGKLPSPSVVHTPITFWIGSIIAFGTILGLQYYATNHLHAGLQALQREMLRREEAEKIKDQTVHNLGERVKELKTLYAVSRILQDEEAAPERQFRHIAEALPAGWQFPEITAARVFVAGAEYTTNNFKPSSYSQRAEMKTGNGALVGIEVVYLEPSPVYDEGPFLKEERHLLNGLVEMLKIDQERKERAAEVKDYKYALDMAAIVSISDVDGSFTFVNENFCKISKYSAYELLGKNHSIIWSGFHPPEYFTELAIAMQKGKPYRGEFCNKAKDGNLYWVDTTIVPFLNEDGNVYQYLSINQNITQRKEVEERVRQSEEKNRAMIENMSDGLVLLDKDWHVVYQSPSVQRITGYTLEERKTKEAHELIHPDDAEIMEQTIRKSLANPGLPVPHHLRVIHKSGKYLWIEGNMVNLLNNSAVGAVMVNYSDITERKKATELFNYQFYNSPDTILIVARDFRIETINRAIPGGLRIEEIIGRDSIEILPVESRKNSRAALVRCFETGENQEFENALTSGRWVRTRMVPMIIDGKISRVMIFGTDVTKLKLAEQDLRRSEIRHRALIENISEAIILIDASENIIFQSSGVTRITGYLPEDSFGEKSFRFIHPEETGNFRAFLQKVYNSPGEPLQAQFRIIHKEGHTIWLEGTLVNLLDNENIKGIVVNYRDVTERKESEEKIRQSEQLLRKITSQVPGNTYMFEIDETGTTKMIFMNRGTDPYNHPYNLEDLANEPQKIREILHEDDRVKFNNAMKEAYQKQSEISCQYRVIANDHIRWRWMQAVPEMDKNGKMVWYGATSDITPLVDYLASVEQIIFDIGHVIRRPISSMLGMTKLINDSNFTEEEIREISRNLYTIAEEMDTFIRELNTAYHQKREDSARFNINIASSIDKRSSLFI